MKSCPIRSIRILVTALMLVACGGDSGAAGGCSDEGFETASVFVIDGAVMDFSDIEAVAESTARIALASLVRDMQVTLGTLDDEAWPDCADDAKALHRDYMTATIDGYLAFMSDEGDAVVQQHQFDALAAWSDATQMMLGLSPDSGSND